MKKVMAALLALVMVLGFAACGEKKEEVPKYDASAKSEGVMTHAQYEEAKAGDKVVIEAYVQAHQTWWDDQVSVYLQDPDGAYFVYKMTCSKEDSEKLVPGTKIKVEGVKGEFAGEVQIVEGSAFTIEEDGTWTAQPLNVTTLIGTGELVKHQNELVAFTGMTVTEAARYRYDGSGQRGDDLYFEAAWEGKTCTFMVESYLRGKSSDVYKYVEMIQPGDLINMEGFLYWYDEANPHITHAEAVVVETNGKK